MQQLTSLAEDYPKFKELGAEVIAISSDTEAFAFSTRFATGATYQILADDQRKSIRAYGILNPTETGGVAHPTVIIVDRQGNIRFIYVGKDPADRPPDETLLEELKKLASV